MNEERFIKVVKVIAVSTLGITALTSALLLIPTKSEGQVVVETFTGDIVYDNAVNSIDYARPLFSYAPDNGKESDESAVNTDQIYYDYPAYYEEVTACNIRSSYSEASKEANTSIYNICKESFDCEDVTFLMPMIIANNESAIRADKNLTFSSLIPSKVFPNVSKQLVESFNCTMCVESPEVFGVMGADWWTRDRGPCQMNPSYGVRADKYNKAMGKSEHAQLTQIEIKEDMTAYTTKEGVINALYWYEQSSTDAGDRFNVRDICLRLSSEYNYALDTVSSIYAPDTPLRKLVMLSMYHGAASLWLDTYTDSQIGYWNSGKLAYKYACALSSDECYSYIYNRAMDDIKSARAIGLNPDIGISVDSAYRIYSALEHDGHIKDVDYYTSDGEYRIDYIVYPIKAIYNYAQLSILYNGG